MAACTSEPTATGPTPTGPIFTGPASPGLTPAVSPSAAGLSCSDSIGHVTALPANYRLVAAAVGVPTDHVLQASPSGETDPAARLFAKWGLVVRAGATVQIAVAPAWANKARVGWGPSAGPATAVRVRACASDGWSAFAGGTWVAEPACVPLVFESAEHTDQIRLPIGVACG